MLRDSFMRRFLHENPSCCFNESNLFITYTHVLTSGGFASVNIIPWALQSHFDEHAAQENQRNLSITVCEKSYPERSDIKRSQNTFHVVMAQINMSVILRGVDCRLPVDTSSGNLHISLEFKIVWCVIRIDVKYRILQRYMPCRSYQIATHQRKVTWTKCLTNSCQRDSVVPRH
jgi:hypothetical protein